MRKKLMQRMRCVMACEMTVDVTDLYAQVDEGKSAQGS